jgi:hypothetical protein
MIYAPMHDLHARSFAAVANQGLGPDLRRAEINSGVSGAPRIPT